MSKAKNFCSTKYCTILFWVSATFSFSLFLLMASRNTVTPTTTIWQASVEAGEDYSKQRTELYEKMSRDLHEHGAAFLAGGETSQSLSLSDLFTLNNGLVTPVLKVADPPVRATVLYLSPKFSQPISQTVKRVLLPHFDKAIWFQDENLYHFSMFHASHHLEPVSATAEEVDLEASAVEEVARTLCPLRIRLERVVLTSTGVLLGCWQVINGTEPAIIRSKLKTALPRAPEKQLYNPVMIHTSFARILGCPRVMDGCQSSNKKAMHTLEDTLSFFHGLVSQVNGDLQGFEATVSEIWFVEEFDVLALALNGRIKARKFHLKCLVT